MSAAAMLAFVACRKEAAPRAAPPADAAAAEVEPADDPEPASPAADRPANDPPPKAIAESPRAPEGDDECNPFISAPERREGSLTVHAPPKVDRRTIKGRLRSHVDGSLSANAKRVWVGPQVPGFVPLTEGTLELFLLERGDGVFVALYRDPYEASSCGLGGSDNCAFVVQAWDDCGELQWKHRLNDFMSAKQHLEVQDMRWADGTLYFNEACQSYSKQAKGKCSSLVALDPVEGEVRWRSKPLLSNNRFLVLGDYLITGYGFTAEPDALFVLRASDGKKVHKTKVPSAHDDLELTEEGTILIASTYKGVLEFELVGFDTDKPKLKKL